MKPLLLVLPALLCSGCAMTPSHVSGVCDHVSHVLQGAPFGPKDEEGVLNTCGVSTTWEQGRAFIEAGLMYQLPRSDLYGDDFLFTSRVGYKLWEKQ
jgi:hypothetical protein